MDNIKDDNYYRLKIVKDLEFLVNHTKDITIDTIENDEVLLDCIMFRLIQISENSDRLSENFKLNNNDISWREIKGMRNKIVHDYGAVDLTIINNVLTFDVPDLLNKLKKL